MQGYTIYQEIWEDDAVKVFRGILGRRTVMIKLIKKEAANLTEAARLHRHPGLQLLYRRQ